MVLVVHITDSIKEWWNLFIVSILHLKQNTYNNDTSKTKKKQEQRLNQIENDNFKKKVTDVR